MPPVQAFKYTDLALMQAGIEALLQKLGYAETMRFLSQMGSGQSDYMRWREQVFAGMTVDEILEQAKEHL